MKKILLVLALILALAAGAFLFYVQPNMDKTSNNQEIVLIQVPKGSSPTKVFHILKDNGIWDDELAYKLISRKLKPALKAGWFEIPPEQTLPQVFAIIESGKNAVRKATIPEGRASWEMPAYLKKAFPKLDENRWNALVQDSKFAKSLGLEANTLEGYLLPDTYPFPIDATEETILKQMVAANLKLRDELKEKSNGSMWSTLGSWHKVLTLASVVEEETGIPSERPLIAGVFHNRLRIGMPLGADPTVRFIFKNLTGPIYKSQLNSDSPYNTRKFKGLMPGPISNPGRKAIEAALYPATTDALYFVAKDDGSMTHFFSSTLADHNKYKDVAAKNRGER
ncbi:endolytic transglycosylase MltG [Fibrobacter sp. UWEL]|uniref:endolytic transglycosylase MltG n=1 Tax=Fibrobacter sp. UWEL TaxID=1896209 RepID=UPI00091F2CF1|nr:endolytic transglycosylase MltG [Fibrobacter sp. UWEL]SHL26264.1 UPF0755 protein [Fibrobacter sp. UWEL]